MSQLATIERIEGKINRQVAGSIGVNPARGLVVQSIDQAMELAKLMSVSDQAVPKHLRGNPGACLAIAIQGYEWSINPFALANKSYVVNDRLAYESALYHAVVQRRAPIKGRIKSEYAGEGPNRTCRVWAVLDDGTNDIVEYTSPKFCVIPVKNSPLWKGDPDQQLFYYSVRAFARKHFPDVMMGIYTVDEILDAPQIAAESPAGSRTDSLAAKLGVTSTPITQRPISEQQEFIPDEIAAANIQAQDSAGGETIDRTTGEITEPENREDAERDPQVEAAYRPTIAEPKSFISHDELVSHLQEVAMTLGREEGPLVAGLAIAVPVAKQNKVSPAERRKLWRDYVKGEGAWASTVGAAAE